MTVPHTDLLADLGDQCVQLGILQTKCAVLRGDADDHDSSVVGSHR